jgi:hypothetical protein
MLHPPQSSILREYTVENKLYTITLIETVAIQGRLIISGYTRIWTSSLVFVEKTYQVYRKQRVYDPSFVNR